MDGKPLAKKLLFPPLWVILLFVSVSAAALVSMLSPETAMFSQFGGDMSIENQRIMIMATGAGIALIVVAMAIYMIVQTTKEIRSL